MEKKLILKNEISEISKLATFIDEVGEEMSLSPELIFNLNLVLHFIGLVEAINIHVFATDSSVTAKIS